MSGFGFRILTANLANGAADADAFADLVEAAEPDVVVVQELAPDQAEALARVLPFGKLEPTRTHDGMGIALESRIIHVVDAYMAMTLDRPYRAAMRAADAIAELERHSGRQFDPAVVGALLEVLAVPLARAA